MEAGSALRRSISDLIRAFQRALVTAMRLKTGCGNQGGRIRRTGLDCNDSYESVTSTTRDENRRWKLAISSSKEERRAATSIPCRAANELPTKHPRHMEVMSWDMHRNKSSSTLGEDMLWASQRRANVWVQLIIWGA